MTQANRRIVRHGDKTTAGGTVLAPGNKHTVMGQQLANVNCKIDCPACNSTGTIQSVPPLATYFDFDGARAAFDGDLCICGCSPHPKLQSSLGNWGVSSFDAPIASTPAAAEWLSFAGHKPEDHGIIANQQFLLVDEMSGEPLADFAYCLECDGQTVSGVTDSDGLTKSIYSQQPASSVMVYVEVPQ